MASDSRRIVVTGGNGYLGSHIVSELSEAGCETVAVDREDHGWKFSKKVDVIRADLDKERHLSSLFKDGDLIVHLAGVKGYEECLKAPDRVVTGNILLTARLLKALQRKRHVRMVFASTYWVYGHLSPLPYNESLPLSPSESYGWSKALAEAMVRRSGVKHTIVRLANVFGVGAGRPCDEVVSLFLNRALSGADLILHNEGLHQLDLISVDQATRALVKLMQFDEENLIVNLGSGEPISIAGLADAVNRVSKKLTGREARIRKGVREEDPILFADRWVHTGKLKDLIGFEPTPLVTCLDVFARRLMDRKSV